MRRARLLFARDIEVEFVDRARAVEQAMEWGRKGTRFPIVIYGPEGCGKTAFFKQVAEVLKVYGYEVVHVDPVSRNPGERLSISDRLRKLVRELPGVFGDIARLLDSASELLYTAIREGLTRRIALLVDDVFQAMGLDKAEQLVKSLLNMIEYPSADYERIVILVASSEGVTKSRVGRHDWAHIMAMWNMSRDGFEELYSWLPSGKPNFEYIWMWCGGNPRCLAKLYEADWNVDTIINELITKRGIVSLVSSLSITEREVLAEALEDPDALFKMIREARGLVEKLIELNLVVEIPEFRESYLWIDIPPEKDLELGIGRHYAWQSPIHREAIKRATSHFAN